MARRAHWVWQCAGSLKISLVKAILTFQATLENIAEVRRGNFFSDHRVTKKVYFFVDMPRLLLAEGRRLQ